MNDSRAGDSDTLLSVEHVSHSFSGIKTVRNVSMHARRGEIVGLIGPNGAGKTTLFNLITGVVATKHGRILFEGRDITGVPAHKIASGGIMRTFQHPRTFRSLGPAEHLVISDHAVSHPMSFLNFFQQMAIPWRDLAPATTALLQKIGLAALIGTPASILPYGRRKNLEIGRCLAGSPRLLLLDEPTAGLNPDEIQSIQSLLISLASDGLTIIVIDHDMDFIGSFCCRLVVLVNGQVLCDGPCHEVLCDPHVVSAYYGAF